MRRTVWSGNRTKHIVKSCAEWCKIGHIVPQSVPKPNWKIRIFCIVQSDIDSPPFSWYLLICMNWPPTCNENPWMSVTNNVFRRAICVASEKRCWRRPCLLWCDCVLQGQCYVMTANLDGETSLKTRHSAALTKQVQSTGLYCTYCWLCRRGPASSWRPCAAVSSARTQTPSWTASSAASRSGPAWVTTCF